MQALAARMQGCKCRGCIRVFTELTRENVTLLTIAVCPVYRYWRGMWTCHGIPSSGPCKVSTTRETYCQLVQQIFEQLCRAQPYADRMLNAMLAGLQEVDRPVLASPV